MGGLELMVVVSNLMAMLNDSSTIELKYNFY
jgi:hypothetical protein